MAWTETLRDGRAWDQERDTPRIRRAFMTLAAGERWPTPRDFLAALPPADRQKALPSRPTNPERAAECMAEIRELLRGMQA